MDDTKFVEVYAISTGEKQTVPEHWLEHPVLGKDFSKTPQQKAAEQLAGPPLKSWTIPQLQAYADEHGIDLAGASLKDDIFAAVDAQALDPTDPTSGTPALNADDI